MISLKPLNIDISINRNLKVIDLSISPFIPKNIAYLTIINKLRGIIYQIQPDILHAHYASSYGLLGRLCNYNPFIISVWGSDVFDFPNKSNIHKWILKSNLNSADIIASTSEAMAKETRKYLKDEKDIFITPFGIDTQVFLPRPNLNFSRNGDLTIGSVKSLDPIYGIPNLVQAFINLSEKYPNLKLLIVGSGSQRSLIESMIKNAGLSGRASIIPRVTHDLVPLYLSKIDIFVVPSYQESFGVAALEASSSELPVIASNVGGLPEVISDGKTGFLVPPGDVSVLTKRLMDLIDSPNLRVIFGKQGRQFVCENYRWEDSIAKMQHLYQLVIDRSFKF